MNVKQLYRGVVVPMVPPMTEDMKLDKAAVTRIAQSFVDNNIHPLLMGTTGEGQLVSAADAIELIETVAAVAKGKVTIYVALTGCVVADQYKAMAPYVAAGADVLVSTLPSYFALTDEQMYRYYVDIAEACPVPFMLYNITLTTHMSIPVDIVKRLADHPNIVGIKDSENNDERMKEIMDFAAEREDFVYFCGCAANSAIALERGAVGIVPSGGNYIPDLYNQLYEAAMNGRHEEARAIQQQTNTICAVYQKGFTLGNSLAALKYLLQLKDICTGQVLPPLTALSEEDKAMVRQRIEQLT